MQMKELQQLIDLAKVEKEKADEDCTMYLKDGRNDEAQYFDGKSTAFSFIVEQAELLLHKQQIGNEPSATIAANSMLGGPKAEPFCTCSNRLPVGTSADGSHYCRGCGLKVQNGT